MNATVANGSYRRNKIHPKKFALYAGCASILMMFVAMTSAYIVRQAAGNWLEFKLPNVFLYSTIVIIASSLTLQGAYRAFINGNSSVYRSLLTLTLGLGLGFLVLQYQGWLAMRDIGVELVGNPSGSFVYVISALHAAHILGGIAALVVAMLHAYSLPHKVTPVRKLRFELTLTYWHFVDFLWIYLFIFLIVV